MSKNHPSKKYCRSYTNENGVRKLTSAYRCYSNMLNRCLNPNTPAYENYGKRGITICQKWLDSFDAFVDDVFPDGWIDGLSINRIDNDLGYFPENVGLATSTEQNNNRRMLKTNTSGVIGVGWIKSSKKWRARIILNGKRISLGSFSCIKEAAKAYTDAAEKNTWSQVELDKAKEMADELDKILKIDLCDICETPTCECFAMTSN